MDIFNFVSMPWIFIMEKYLNSRILVQVFPERFENLFNSQIIINPN